eukprot:222429-Chlamydomonas_euryale.AAC.3
MGCTGSVHTEGVREELVVCVEGRAGVAICTRAAATAALSAAAVAALAIANKAALSIVSGRSSSGIKTSGAAGQQPDSSSAGGSTSTGAACSSAAAAAAPLARPYHRHRALAQRRIQPHDAQTARRAPRRPCQHRLRNARAPQLHGPRLCADRSEQLWRQREAQHAHTCRRRRPSHTSVAWAGDRSAKGGRFQRKTQEVSKIAHAGGKSYGRDGYGAADAGRYGWACNIRMCR